MHRLKLSQAKPTHVCRKAPTVFGHTSSPLSLSISVSQTLLQKEVKQTARQNGSCQTVASLLHTDLLLSFFFFFWHYVNSVWSCRRTEVDQSSLHYLFFDMRRSLLLLVIPFSLPVSLLFFFTCSLYRVSGSTWVCVCVCPCGCPFMLKSHEEQRKKNPVQHWILSE